MLPLTIGPNRPNRTRPPKHTGAWQPEQMPNRTEGVGGPPGSRICSLFPLLPAQVPHQSPAFGKSQGRMEALSWMCQWSNLDVQAVSWLFWVSLFPSGIRSVWWQDSPPWRFLRLWSILFFLNHTFTKSTFKTYQNGGRQSRWPLCLRGNGHKLCR